MTESPAVVEETEVVETEVEAEESNLPDLEALGELAVLLVDRAKAAREKLLEVAESQAKTGNVGQLLSEAIENSNDPEVVAQRTRIERAEAAILEAEKICEAKVKPTLNLPSEAELKALSESYTSLATSVKVFDTAFTAEIKADHPDITIYNYIGELPKGKRGGGASGAKAGQGDGTSRPRVSAVEVSSDLGKTYTKVEKDGKSTFSHLVTWLKKETGESITAADLHEPWLKQNGVTEWTDLQEVSTFSYSLKGTSYMVRVTR